MSDIEGDDEVNIELIVLADFVSILYTYLLTFCISVSRCSGIITTVRITYLPYVTIFSTLQIFPRNLSKKKVIFFKSFLL